MSIAAATTLNPAQLDQLSVDTVRFLSVDAVQKPNSGHPGLPLGAAPIAYLLWTRFLQHNPANPQWLNRDRRLPWRVWVGGTTRQDIFLRAIQRRGASGTEDICKIYAESFRGADHLRRFLEEAQAIVSDALAASPRQPGIPF